MVNSIEVNDELLDRWDDLKHCEAKDYDSTLKEVKDLAGLLKQAEDMESEAELKRRELDIEEYKAKTERLKIESDERIAKRQATTKAIGTGTVVILTTLILFKEDTGTITSKAWNFISSNLGKMIQVV